MYFVYFMSAFILSIVFTYYCIKVAKKYNIVDIPNERKIHKQPIPYLGGVAIYFSFLLVFIAAIKISTPLNLEGNIIGFLFGSFIIFIFGLYDDIRGANAFFKFFFQIVVALILIKFGYIIDRITNPTGGTFYLPYWLSVLVTVFWIVGIINAINLLDGLDGLAAGVIGIASFFLFIIAMASHNILISIMSIILTGTTIGFLVFNFPPAKIFMGDTGSMFLGLLFSVISIVGSRKSAVAINLIIPIVLLSIPILDTLLAIVRRARKRKNIFQADKEHIHHRLLNLGIPYSKVIILIYMFCIYLGLISLISLYLPKEFMFIIFLIISVNIFIGLYALNLLEKHIKK